MHWHRLSSNAMEHTPSRVSDHAEKSQRVPGTGARVVKFAGRYYLEAPSGSFCAVSGGRRAMGVFDSFEAAAATWEAR